MFLVFYFTVIVYRRRKIMICNLCKKLDYNILWKHKILFFNGHASDFVYMVKETWQFGHKIVFTLSNKM